MIWGRCPLVAANKVTERGKIRVGWTIVKVELLAKRPLQCYCCWEFGHVRFSCRATTDRNGHCFNCGKPGHTARACERREPRCILYEKKGMDANHRIGTRDCEAVRRGLSSTQQSRQNSMETSRGGMVDKNLGRRGKDKGKDEYDGIMEYAEGS